MDDSSAPTDWFERSLQKLFADSRSFFFDAMIALKLNSITGDYVEFGSWGAKSLAVAYETIRLLEVDRRIWAFDSFQGLPESDDARDEHPSWGRGGRGNRFGPRKGDPAEMTEQGLADFHAACEMYGVPRDAYTPVVGFYEDTLPALGDTGDPTDIAMVYVDCNMYSSTVTVLEFLRPRLKHGMILAFDDYSLWTPTDVSGQRRALEEFRRDNPQWRFPPFKDVHWGGRSFVVERADLLGSDDPPA